MFSPNLPLSGPNLQLSGPNRRLFTSDLALSGPNLPWFAPDLLLSAASLPWFASDLRLSGPNPPLSGLNLPWFGPSLPWFVANHGCFGSFGPRFARFHVFSPGPPPNNALQRTGHGGQPFSCIHALRRHGLSLSLGPLGPESLAWVFRWRACSRSLCLHASSSGQSVPPFVLSRRQRPSFPRRSRGWFPFVRSVGAGLTMRSSEQAGRCGLFCSSELVFALPVAELEFVRRLHALCNPP